MRIVVAVVVLVAMGFLASKFLSSDSEVPVAGPKEPPLRDEPATSAANSVDPVEPEPNSEAPLEESDEESVRVVVLDGGVGFNEMMEALGITDLEERFTKWSTTRGFPFSDRTGTYLLEQPYDQYDDDTLRAFAENEDMWAQQFLAERLEKTRPAEALDWYRKAAINGSVHAMDRITTLYRRIGMSRADSPTHDDIYKEQTYAIRDGAGSVDEMSFAWSVAAVMAGADPSRNKALSERLSRNFDDDTRERACQMASGLYDDISTARSERNLPDFDRTPPPFMLGSMNDMSSGACGGISNVQHIDFSGCEEIEVMSNGIGSRVVVCTGN